MSEVQNNANTQDKQEEAFDLLGLLLDYLSNWKWFVLCFIVLSFYVSDGKKKWSILYL